MTTAFIGLGANLGDRLASLRQGAEAIATLGEVLGRSQVYETAPVSMVNPAQPDYLNAALILETPHGPQQLLAHLLRIEATLGRLREPGLRDQPRTLDLDVLLLGDHGDEVLHLPSSVGRERLPGLVVPHPRLHQRSFALLPLLDLDPHLIHPVLGVPLRDMCVKLLEKSEIRHPRGVALL